ncbi:hypothetical protein BDV27DRAFT_34880 [Aspergillus caelatus]|uniref:Uncharacterized protein n=1 Tax=Aspergillus caelatus TaxID=61420 RepID=A0A5N6ZV50_9EURO|nr:uncharacterized protein BDV27DRAFT_34880 [Aspergillus caelatus]KAE8360799.1 hypothetical protein BDV27DRAFT_34880 [Aspergillus caelatus]
MISSPTIIEGRKKSKKKKKKNEESDHLLTSSRVPRARHLGVLAAKKKQKKESLSAAFELCLFFLSLSWTSALSYYCLSMALL